MSQPKPGDSFRQKVANLLSAAKYNDVRQEILIGTKKVDIVCTKRDLTKTRIYGVECKDWSSPLTKADMTKIYADYMPLIQKGLITDLLIVAPQDIQGVARAYAESLKDAVFCTFAELQKTVMDFQTYLDVLEAIYKEDGLNEYFVEPITDTGQDLISLVEDWIAGESNQPLAILGSYGLGKTSFAKHLAFKYAQKVSRDSSARIPVLLPLSDISSEQQLEGLLGKTLAGLRSVPGYHFHTFMDLNKSGRLLVILDGFDEMKHGMTFGQFKHNFGELNRLVDGEARVLLLGRPSAFLSESEHQFILRGIRIVNELELHEPNWPAYREVRIGNFEKVQSSKFIRNYLNYRVKKPKYDNAPVLDAKMAEERIALLEKPSYSELVNRPVHARMLVDLASDPRNLLPDLNAYSLYDLFIRYTIERESDKPQRLLFSTDDRRAFARELAWWSWQSGQFSGFPVEIVPNTVFDRVTKNLITDVDYDGLKRDLISACFLDRKTGGTLYFPHRSFQEFLVAEYFLNSEINPKTVPLLSKSLNLEISRFIKESKQFARISNACFENLEGAFGSIGNLFLEIAGHSATAEQLKLRELKDPWQVAAKTIGKLDSRESAGELEAFANELELLATQGAGDRLRLTAFLCYLLLVQRRLSGRIDPIIHACSIIVRNIDFNSLIQRKSSKGQFIIPQFARSEWLHMFIKDFKRVSQRESKETAIDVDLLPVVERALNALKPFNDCEELAQLISQTQRRVAIRDIAKIIPDQHKMDPVWTFVNKTIDFSHVIFVATHSSSKIAKNSST